MWWPCDFNIQQGNQILLLIVLSICYLKHLGLHEKQASIIILHDHEILRNEYLKSCQLTIANIVTIVITLDQCHGWFFMNSKFYQSNKCNYGQEYVSGRCLPLKQEVALWYTASEWITMLFLRQKH